MTTQTEKIDVVFLTQRKADWKPGDQIGMSETVYVNGSYVDSSLHDVENILTIAGVNYEIRDLLRITDQAGRFQSDLSDYDQSELRVCE